MVQDNNNFFRPRGMVGINRYSGSKTTTKNCTNPSTRISSRLLTLFRKVNFEIQEDDSNAVDLNMEMFNELQAQAVSTFNHLN